MCLRVNESVWREWVPLRSCRREGCLWAPSPGWLSGLLGFPEEQGPGLCLSTLTCAKWVYSGWSYSGPPLSTPPTGPFSGKEFNFFRSISVLDFLGVVMVNIIVVSLHFLFLPPGLTTVNRFLSAESRLQGIPVGLNNEEFIILYNKQSRGSASPGFANITAQQHQQVADCFHLFSDNLSISSWLSS